jgi:hypothetical protein
MSVCGAWSRRSRSCSRRSSSSWASPPCACSTAAESRSRADRAARGRDPGLHPTVDALYTPDIDDSLDEEGAKHRFWRAFRTLGTGTRTCRPY